MNDEPRGFQFSVRALFMATTLCGIGLALGIRILPRLRNDQPLLLATILLPLAAGSLLALAGHRLAARVPERDPLQLVSKLLVGTGTLIAASTTAWIAVVVLAWLE